MLEKDSSRCCAPYSNVGCYSELEVLAVRKLIFIPSALSRYAQATSGKYFSYHIIQMILNTCESLHALSVYRNRKTVIGRGNESMT